MCSRDYSWVQLLLLVLTICSSTQLHLRAVAVSKENSMSINYSCIRRLPASIPAVFNSSLHNLRAATSLLHSAPTVHYASHHDSIAPSFWLLFASQKPLLSNAREIFFLRLPSSNVTKQEATPFKYPFSWNAMNGELENENTFLSFLLVFPNFHRELQISLPRARSLSIAICRYAPSHQSYMRNASSRGRLGFIHKSARNHSSSRCELRKNITKQ